MVYGIFVDAEGFLLDLFALCLILLNNHQISFNEYLLYM
jgi:hypothetical protein